MKCPKCHYLSFDPEPRCRNCGYTLALDPDLAIHPDPAPAVPLGDLALRESDAPVPTFRDEAPRSPTPRRTAPAAPVEPVRRARTTTPGPFDASPDEPAEANAEAVTGPDLFESEPPMSDEPVAPVRPTSEGRPRRQAPPPTTELPLFVKGMGAEVAPPAIAVPATDNDLDLPLTAPPAGGLPPLSVRRSVDAPARARGVEIPKLGPLDRDLLEGLQRIEHADQRRAAAEARRVQDEHRASAGRRLGAAAVDAALLGAIGAAIVSITLRWAGLEWSQIQLLPTAPLLAFVLLVVTGYLFMFTAAIGQTAGKMLMGIRVVDAGEPGIGEHRVSLRQALYRGALTVPSVLLLGAGFLPALTGDGRAIHDRLTHTRVVRA